MAGEEKKMKFDTKALGGRVRVWKVRGTKPSAVRLQQGSTNNGGGGRAWSFFANEKEEGESMVSLSLLLLGTKS